MNKTLFSAVMLVLALEAGADGAPLLTNEFRDLSHHGRWIVSRADGGAACALSTTTTGDEHAYGGIVLAAMAGHNILLVSYALPDYAIRDGDKVTSNAFMGNTHFLSFAYVDHQRHVIAGDYLPQGIGSAPVSLGQSFIDGLTSAEGNIGGMRFEFMNMSNDSDDPHITETEIDPAVKGVRQAVADFRACVQKAGISLPP